MSGTGNGKTYSCKQCGATFENHYKLAGHVSNQHRQHRRQVPRAAKEKPEGGAVCPLCAQDLPLAVSGLASQFEQEGVPEDQAMRLAAMAWGGLRVPA